MSALPAQLDGKLTAALAAELAKAEADERAAADAVGWWNDWTAGGSAAGAVASAAAGRRLYDVHEDRAARVRASGDVEELLSLMQDLGAELDRGSVVQQLAPELTFTGGVGRIAKDSAKDAADVAVGVGRGWLAVLKASPFIVVGLAVLAVVLFVKRRPTP